MPKQMRIGSWFAVLALVGCGRFGFDPVAAHDDADVMNDMGIDSPMSADMSSVDMNAVDMQSDAPDVDAGDAGDAETQATQHCLR